MKFFKKYGWFYIPISLIGIIITILILALIIQIFIFVDLKSHSVSDTFYGIFPYVIGYLIIYWWAASNSS